MIEDDGGFMRRETRRDSILELYCDDCGKLIDDNDEVVCADWWDGNGRVFCSQACCEECRIAECEAREFSKYEREYD